MSQETLFIAKRQNDFDLCFFTAFVKEVAQTTVKGYSQRFKHLANNCIAAAGFPFVPCKNILTRIISRQSAKKVPKTNGFRNFGGIPTALGYNAPCFERMVHILLVPF